MSQKMETPYSEEESYS